MGTETAGGRKRGQPVIDWNEAFLFYASLPRDQRTYQAVADRFAVSVRTVERHGLQERWRQRAGAVDDKAVAAATDELSIERAANLKTLEKLIDASYLRYAQELRDGTARVAPADLSRLYKLQQELRNDPAATPHPASSAAGTDSATTAAHRLEVLRGLHEAGALERLQQQLDEPTASTTIKEPRP